MDVFPDFFQNVRFFQNCLLIQDYQKLSFTICTLFFNSVYLYCKKMLVISKIFHGSLVSLLFVYIFQNCWGGPAEGASEKAETVSRLIRSRVENWKRKHADIDTICESSYIEVIFNFTIDFCWVILYLVFIPSVQTIFRKFVYITFLPSNLTNVSTWGNLKF